MGFLQLQYFKLLAEKEHLTNTAKELMVSAPSLSASISRLEKKIGFKLFDRTGKKMLLNDCGRIYLKHVNNVFSSLDNAVLEMSEFTNSQSNRISIAISSPIVWLDVFQTFIKQRPDIVISHTLVKTHQMDDFSYCSQFDFIVTARDDLPGKDWDFEVLIPNDQVYFSVYPNHRFAKLKEVSFVEAREENFIAISQGFSMRRFFDGLCRQAGFAPKIVLECDYLLRPKMLAAECGIVFTTESAWRTNSMGDAVFVKISDPTIRRTQVIAWNKSRYLSSNALAFKNFMMEYHQKNN